MIVFDFSNDTSIEGYESIARRLNDLDISILINNVGVANSKPSVYAEEPIDEVYNEVIVNIYPIVMLTKVLIPKIEKRYKTMKKRALLINLSSQAAFFPNPYFANYGATKAFDDRLSKSLYFELKGKGVDVLTVRPGVVTTKLNGMKEKFAQNISVESCVSGILGNAKSFLTYGGAWHEVHGLFVENLF